MRSLPGVRRSRPCRRFSRRLPPPDGDGQAPELITVLAGDGTPVGLGELELDLDEPVELELRHGGQPAYWWLLAAE